MAPSKKQREKRRRVKRRGPTSEGGEMHTPFATQRTRAEWSIIRKLIGAKR